MLMGMSVGVSAGLRQIRIGRTHDQLAVLHAFDADQAIGQFLYLSELALHDYHLQAHVVVEMGMHGRDNDFVILMLQLHEFVREKPGMMIVNKSYGADHEGLRRLQTGSVQAVANEVAESLGAIAVTLGNDVAVKPFQQIRIEGNADPAKQTHGENSQAKNAANRHGSTYIIFMLQQRAPKGSYVKRGA